MHLTAKLSPATKTVDNWQQCQVTAINPKTNHEVTATGYGTTNALALADAFKDLQIILNLYK